ncbi:MAG TPA: flavin reductase family protein [Anaerolineaceae bacterium]|jgi:flavin reductase (DIM6/NTAB) family NADH-FMN oxidoreductase RutF
MDFQAFPQADPESLRSAMQNWVAGVTVVTSAFQGELHGMTVSSFTSISATPPMILVSLERGARTHALIHQSGFFGVTLLTNQQEWLSDRFAGRTGLESDRFSGLETFHLISNSPLLPGGLAYFDCRVVNSFQAGTSTVFLAEVMAAQSAISGDPLVYTNRAYRRLMP